MTTKIKRHNFCFTAKTDSLLRRIKEKTELSFTVIVKEALELLAEKKGISNEE